MFKPFLYALVCVQEKKEDKKVVSRLLVHVGLVVGILAFLGSGGISWKYIHTSEIFLLGNVALFPSF